MDHTWKNGSHLDKRVTLVKISHNLEKKGHIRKKRVTIGKIGNT